MTSSDRPGVAPLLLLGAGASTVAALAIDATTSASRWSAVLAAAIAVVSIALAIASVLAWTALPSVLAASDAIIAGYVLIGLLMWRGWSDGNPIAGVTALVSLVVFLAAVGLLWFRICNAVSQFDVVGVVTIVAVAAALTAAVLAVARPFADDWLWAQFLSVAAGVVVSLILAAWDWSRAALLTTVLVLSAVLVAFVVHVGYQAQRQDAFTTPIEAAVVALDLGPEDVVDVPSSEPSSVLAKTLADLEASLPAAPAEFADAGAAVWRSLSAVPPRVKAARADLALMLALDIPRRQTVQALAVRDRATAAFEAGVEATSTNDDAAQTGPSPRDDLEVAARDACIASERASLNIEACELIPEPKPTPETETETENASSSVSPGLVLQRLNAAVAFYRNAVDPSDENKAAAAEAATAGPVDLELSLLGAVSDGPSAIADSVDPDDPLRLAPGPVGWFLLALLALMAFRGLLKLNARQMAGPVNIAYAGGHADELRIAVLKNLKTPGATPGSAVADSVTDLTSIVGPAGGIIGGIVKAINTVLQRDTGYVIDADVAPPPATGSGDPSEKSTTEASAAPTSKTEESTRVLIRVESAASKDSLGTAIFSDASPEKAMQSAGLWAAGLLLGRSTRIPSWASWNQSTAESLGAASLDNPTLDDLEAAVAAAPTSGLLLQKYGNKLELEGQQIAAIGVYARAVVSHPRFLIARYRLAIALGMMGRDLNVWNAASLAERSSTVLVVERAVNRLGIDAGLVTPLNAPSAGEGDFFALACALLSTVETDVVWWRAWSAKLRRQDRSEEWLTWRFGRPASGRRTKWLTRSARLTYEMDGPNPNDVAQVEDEARRPTSSWQVSYNLACLHSCSGSLGDAERWLENCLLRPDIPELDEAWVKQDPDLAAIRNRPRFRRFCTLLSQRSST